MKIVTEEQRIILDHLANGHTNTEIGYFIGKSQSYVTNCISTLLLENDARNRTHLIAKYLEK